MRNAETILGIIRERGQRGLPVKDAYRLLYQRDLYLRAYGQLYRNQGAMTPGITSETETGCRWRKSTPSSTRCAMRGIDGRQCDAHMCPNRMGNGGH